MIAEILYINKDYVRAIESGNFSIFPSKIFAKAYFDKYRKFLGINCQLPDVFDDIESKELKNLKKEVRLPYDWNKKIKKFSAIIASLFLLALLFYFIPNSVSISEQDTTIQEINPERLKPLEESVFNNNIIQNNSFKKDNENEIFLSFTSSSWIEIYVNNELIEAQQFKAGDTYSRKVQIPFKIVVGNADSLKGTYNGEMIDFSTDNDSLYAGKQYFLMMNNWIKRKKTKTIMVGSVPVGGDNPISIQSMTNTDTCDVVSTVKQIKDLELAGADIVRVSVPGYEEAKAFKEIKKAVNVPLVADIHFDYKIALEVADTADCLRINPGNIGKEDRVKEVINAATDNNVPIRVGVNAGSLEKDLQKKYGEPNADALVESALRHVEILDRFNFENYKMSLKASNIEMTVDAYRKVSDLIKQPLHLGITEAGSFRAGTVKSSIGVGMLLSEGIGDTIRISLASDPVDEIKVGWDILKSLNIRSRGVKIIACPSCSRQNFNVIKVVNELEQRLEDISEDIEVAIIGCYVNGPGESKAANIGLTGASPKNLLYVDGAPNKKISNDNLVNELEDQVRKKVAQSKTDSEKIILRS